MQFTIERGVLLKALGHGQGIVERRATIPILSNLLLQANGRGLQTTATDMDMALDQELDADVVQGGATTVPAHLLHEIVRKLPEGSQVGVRTAEEGGQVEIVSGRSKVTLPARDSSEFPVLEAGDMPHAFSVPAATLGRAIDRTRFAMSTEETRYYLNGIYLHAAEAGDAPVLRAVATDGHRLARADLPLPEGAGGMPGVIVPRKAVTEVRKLIDQDAESGGDGGDVRIALSETKISFASGKAALKSKLIDGTFPDYTRVIPVGNDKMLEIRRAEFENAVDLVSTVSIEKTRAVKLSLDSGNLVLTATSPDSGSAREELDVGYSDEPLEIGFNSRYLLDITHQIGSESAKFRLADGSSPALVEDMGDSSALYVLMPMRV